MCEIQARRMVSITNQLKLKAPFSPLNAKSILSIENKKEND